MIVDFEDDKEYAFYYAEGDQIVVMKSIVKNGIIHGTFEGQDGDYCLISTLPARLCINEDVEVYLGEV